MDRQALRIAVLLPTLNAGGAERSMINLAGGLTERGFQVDLVLITAKGEMLNEVPDSVRLVDLDSRRAATSLPALISYLRQHRPDAMLSGLDFVNILAIAAWRLDRARTRLVISQRSMLSRSAEFAAKRMGRITPKLARWFYPRAEQIVAVSQGVADDMIQAFGIPAEKVKVIYNPISTEKILSLAQQTCNHPWLKDNGSPIVMAVGRLAKVKDFSTLIRAFSLVVQEKDARLIILGEGPERGRLEALVAEFRLKSSVLLPGFIANPYPWMKQAAVVVLSSQAEGLPGVLLEALTCGTPVIATDCSGGPREILQEGKLGTLIPVGDENEMAKVITSVLTTNVRQQLAAGLQAFEPQVVLSQYEQVLFPNLYFEPLTAD